MNQKTKQTKTLLDFVEAVLCNGSSVVCCKGKAIQ